MANRHYYKREQPLTTSRSGGGAKNRVLETECTKALFDSPAVVADCVKQNYGHAGERFINKLTEIGIDELRAMYAETVNEIAQVTRSTDKQRNSAAYILMADRIATDLFFKDGNGLAALDFSGLLQDAAEIKTYNRALDYLRGWVASNRERFEPTTATGTIYGRIEMSGQTIIIGTIFDDIMTAAGFSSAAFLGSAERAGILHRDSEGKRKKKVRFKDTTARCVVIDLEGTNDDLPF